MGTGHTALSRTRWLETTGRHHGTQWDSALGACKGLSKEPHTVVRGQHCALSPWRLELGAGKYQAGPLGMRQKLACLAPQGAPCLRVQVWR